MSEPIRSALNTVAACAGVTVASTVGLVASAAATSGATGSASTAATTVAAKRAAASKLVNGGVGLTVQLVGAVHLRTDLRWMGAFFGDANASHGPL